MEKLRKNRLIYTIIAIIISPILVSILCKVADYNPIKLINIGENSDWISFWGSVLGAIFGVVGTFFVLQVQLTSDKNKERLKELEDERPYFFIEGSSYGELNFEFYNAKHSLLNNLEVYFFLGNENENNYIYSSLGHIKADTKYRVGYFAGEECISGIDNISPNNGVIIKGTTLLDEKISFIYGSFGKGHGISKTFYYDVTDKKKTGIYSGDKINDETFDDLISNIIAEKIKLNAIKVNLYLVYNKY